MRRPPVPLPPSSNNNNNQQQTDEPESDPTNTKPPQTSSVLLNNNNNNSHQMHRPQLGHLPPTHPTTTSNNNSSNASKPPLFSNIPSFAVTTMPGSNAHNRQKMEGNGPPPPMKNFFSGGGNNAFPQFTRDGSSNNNKQTLNDNYSSEEDRKLVEGFGQSEEGTMNFLLGSSTNASSSNTNNQNHQQQSLQRKNSLSSHHRQNAAFEFYVNIPSSPPSTFASPTTCSEDSSQPRCDDDDENEDGENSPDKFFVRLWGPKYLFSQQPKEGCVNPEAVISAIKDKIVDHHHRLIVFLHGAGMSSMGFHLVACQMLNIDPNDDFIKIEEGDVALLNPKNTKCKSEKTVGSNDDDDAATTSTSTTNQNLTISSTVTVSHNQSSSSTNPQPIIIAFDYRGHGKTKMHPPQDGKGLSYDLHDIALDTTKVIERMFDIGSSLKKRISRSSATNDDEKTSTSDPKLFWAPDQSVCLIGHSMGGSVASVVSENPQWRQKLFGLVLLDIVEGTALESIRHMPDFLKRRPKTFSSEMEAVHWFVRFGGMRDIDSAKLSVPTLIKPIHRDGENSSSSSSSSLATKTAEDAALVAPSKTNETVSLKNYEWITDLSKTEAYWNTWFNGLDGRFLHAICPRMLCLSSRDTLDKDLTVAHMQGQFQLEIFRDCGHYLMEDQPHMVAPVLMRFINRIEQQNEKLKAVYMKKFGVTAGAGINSSASTPAVFTAQQQPISNNMSHVVNPHANLGTPASTVIPTFYRPGAGGNTTNRN